MEGFMGRNTKLVIGILMCVEIPHFVRNDGKYKILEHYVGDI